MDFCLMKLKKGFENMKFPKILLISTALMALTPVITFAMDEQKTPVEEVALQNGLTKPTVEALNTVSIPVDFNFVIASRARVTTDSSRQGFFDGAFARVQALYGSGMANAMAAFNAEKKRLEETYEKADDPRVRTSIRKIGFNSDLIFPLDQEVGGALRMMNSETAKVISELWGAVRDDFMPQLQTLLSLDPDSSARVQGNMRGEAEVLIMALASAVGQVAREVETLNQDLQRISEAAIKNRAAKELPSVDSQREQSTVGEILGAVDASESERIARTKMVQETLLAPYTVGATWYTRLPVVSWFMGSKPTRESLVESFYNPAISPEVVHAVIGAARIFMKPSLVEGESSDLAARKQRDYEQLMTILFSPEGSAFTPPLEDLLASRIVSSSGGSFASAAITPASVPAPAPTPAPVVALVDTAPIAPAITPAPVAYQANGHVLSAKVETLRGHGYGIKGDHVPLILSVLNGASLESGQKAELLGKITSRLSQPEDRGNEHKVLGRALDTYVHAKLEGRDIPQETVDVLRQHGILS